MSEHAILAPSSAHRWMTCTASLAMELGKPNRTSKFSDEGTAAHELAAMCLNSGMNTAAYAGRRIDVKREDGYVSSSWEVNDEMQMQVQKYLDNARKYAGGNLLFVEERVDFSDVVGFPKSFGTADGIIIDIRNRELQIHDLKYGRGVQVSAKENEQLMIYALGALALFNLCYAFDRVRLVIHQVRLRDTPDEWLVSIKDLHEFSTKVHAAALLAMQIRTGAKGDFTYKDRISPGYFDPNEGNCRFCKASGSCPAQDKRVEQTVDDKSNLELADQMARVGFIEDWCKAKRARTEAELLAGGVVRGWKLVTGKKGNRVFGNETQAERIMAAALTPDDMFTKELISPARAEKLLKKQAPETWTRLETLITQSEGKPHVAPDSDAREAIACKPAVDDFEVLG